MTGYASNTMLMEGLDWLVETVEESAESFRTTDSWTLRVWITINKDMPETCEDAWDNALAKREIASEEMTFEDYPLFYLPAEADDGMILPFGAIGSMRGISSGVARYICLMKRQAQQGNDEEPFLYEMLYIAKIPESEQIEIEERKPVCINPWCIKNYLPEEEEES